MSPPATSTGRFITFEGVEGSGKSTQIRRLAERLDTAGVVTRITKEPGGTDLGQQLRSLLLDASGGPITPTAELLLYAADRAQHLEQVIEPALLRGEVVLCDRFVDATLAYQGHARGLGADVVLELHRHPPLDRRPDRTLVLDVDPQRALGRARRRNRRQRLGEAEGRFEDESLEFHRRVREGYLQLAEAHSDRIRVVPANGDLEQVHALVLDALRDLLPELE